MLKKIFYQNRLAPSVYFFPAIYFVGWSSISLISTFSPELQQNKSLLGTLITAILFIIILPYWSRHRWGKNIIDGVGLRCWRKNNISSLLNEFLKSILIISFIALLILCFDYGQYSLNFNIGVVLNSILLFIAVGVLEELIFRVWLYEELNLWFNQKISNLLQALIFAIVHLKFQMDIMNTIQLLIGLFLLGLYLNSWRKRTHGNIMIPICFHGSIVALWFFINNSLLLVTNDIPELFFGPGSNDSFNPVGGLLGIFMLLILNMFYTPIFSDFLSFSGRTLRDSSNDDLP